MRENRGNMVAPLFHNILDSKRKKLLPQLDFLKDRFYLAGGTALALQIGHRTSVDFDFFTDTPFDNMQFYFQLEEAFCNDEIEKIQDSKDTLSVVLNKEIKISFFKIPYPVINPLIETDYIRLLTVLEIGAMKLIALTRAAYRDYVDLYFILQQYSLKRIFELCHKKFKNFDEGIYLKCLFSFHDIEIAPIHFQEGFHKEKEEIFSSIESKTRDYIRTIS